MDEFRVCLSCGYERGFHVSFKRDGSRIKIFLICPDCGQSFNIGWNETDLESLEPEKGERF